jgi:hypothetical protein
MLHFSNMVKKDVYKCFLANPKIQNIANPTMCVAKT